MQSKNVLSESLIQVFDGIKLNYKSIEDDAVFFLIASFELFIFTKFPNEDVALDSKITFEQSKKHFDNFRDKVLVDPRLKIRLEHIIEQYLDLNEAEREVRIDNIKKKIYQIYSRNNVNIVND